MSMRLRVRRGKPEHSFRTGRGALGQLIVEGPEALDIYHLRERVSGAKSNH